MSNLRFEPVWISFTTRNLTSWAKPTLTIRIQLVFGFQLERCLSIKATENGFCNQSLKKYSLPVAELIFGGCG
jgi:hypothetical protein